MNLNIDDIFSFIKTNLLWIVLIISILIFINYIRPRRMFEGFEDADEYKYLEKLPENNTWSTDTQQAFKDKTKQLNANMTDDQLNKQVTDAMKVASEEEAKYYNDNGSWPYDNYVIDTLNSLKTSNESLKNLDVTQLQKTAPNRIAYKMFILPNTLPQYKVLKKLNNDGYQISDSEILKCKNQNILLHNTTTNTDITPNITQTTDAPPVDVNIFEKITGLKFDGDPCNICNEGDVISSKCSFSMEGDPTPMAYNIYSGKQIINTYTSAPSLLDNENSITLPTKLNIPTNMF